METLVNLITNSIVLIGAAALMCCIVLSGDVADDETP